MLPSNSRLYKVEVITEVMTSGDSISISLYDSKSGGTTSIGAMTFAADGGIAQKTFVRKDIESAYVQVRVSWSSDLGIKQIKVYYEPIEKEV